jgi:inward rectifier potassium channel
MSFLDRFSRAREEPDEIEIVGEGRGDWTDVYHFLLRSPWWLDFLGIGCVFVVSNLVFAALFQLTGGVQNAGSYRQLFYFSVQTMGTIGYGALYPVGDAANLLVVLESIFGLILTALCTGLVFAKFSVPRGRVRFARQVTVSRYDGKRVLMLRLGNGRSNRLLEARAKLVMVRTERTREGQLYYRMHDLPLTRSESPFFTRSWTAMHLLDEASLLHGVTPEVLVRDEVELVCSLSGIDDTSGQTMHGRRRYLPGDWAFGKRHADLLSELPGGRLRLDLSRFDVLEDEPQQP